MNWTEQQIQHAWENGQVVENANPARWRKDACGAWIARDHYNDIKSVFGWDIEQVDSNGSRGADQLTSVRACQWKNLRSKMEGKRACPVIANGGLNLDFSAINA